MEFGVEFICVSVFTGLCILLAFAYRYVTRFYSYFDKLEISGPVPTFLYGTWHETIGKFIGDVDVMNAKLYGKVYGTYDSITPNLMVIDPEIVKQILLTHADKFDDKRVAGAKNPILKKTLSFLYSEGDREIQALMNSLLPDSKIKKLLPRLESSANRFVQNILKLREEVTGLNWVAEVNEYIHDVIAFTIFGIELNADVSFKEDFAAHCNQIFTIKKPNSRMTLMSYLHENLHKDSWILPEKTMEYFINLIKSGINDSPRDPVLTEGKAATLIELLVEAAEEEKKLLKSEKEEENAKILLTDELIIVKCLSVILALINSARTVVLLTLHSLASQQEIQDEFSIEIKKNNYEKLSSADLQNLQILDMVIAEVLRLYPSEFRLEKICTESVTIDKFSFGVGTRVSIPLYALHMHEDHYAEPEKFDARRFSQEAIENRNPFVYLPFGQPGVNTYSMGVQLALLSSKIGILKLAEKLKFKISEDYIKPVFQAGVTGVPKLLSLNITTELK